MNGARGEGRDVRNVIVIGSGPAGLTAALHPPAPISPLVIGAEAGGQLMLMCSSRTFRASRKGAAGPDLMGDMRAQAEHFRGMPSART